MFYAPRMNYYVRISAAAAGWMLLRTTGCCDWCERSVWLVAYASPTSSARSGCAPPRRAVQALGTNNNTSRPDQTCIRGAGNKSYTEYINVTKAKTFISMVFNIWRGQNFRPCIHRILACIQQQHLFKQIGIIVDTKYLLQFSMSIFIIKTKSIHKYIYICFMDLQLDRCIKKRLRYVPLQIPVSLWIYLLWKSNYATFKNNSVIVNLYYDTIILIGRMHIFMMFCYNNIDPQ